MNQLSCKEMNTDDLKFALHNQIIGLASPLYHYYFTLSICMNMNITGTYSPNICFPIRYWLLLACISKYFNFPSWVIIKPLLDIMTDLW
jgi:hypothetical protein